MLEARVHPRSSRSRIGFREGDGGLVIHVTAAPEGGKANEAAVALLSKGLGMGKTRVRLLRGHRARSKRTRVEGMSSAQALSALRSRGAGPAAAE